MTAQSGSTAAAVRGAEGKQCAPQQLTSIDAVFYGADRKKHVEMCLIPQARC